MLMIEGLALGLMAASLVQLMQLVNLMGEIWWCIDTPIICGVLY